MTRDARSQLETARIEAELEVRDGRGLEAELGCSADQKMFHPDGRASFCPEGIEPKH